MASVNAHDPKYREAKPPQANASTPVADLFRLSGRTIVVTGGAGALGSAVVRAVLESGGDVVCLDVVDVPAESVWGMTLFSFMDHHLSLMNGSLNKCRWFKGNCQSCRNLSFILQV